MASIQQRKRNKNRPWAVQWRTPAGKHAEKAFASRAEARRFLVGLEHDLATGTYVDRSRGQVPFTEYAAAVVAGMDIASGSRKIYEGMLRVWVGPWAGTRTLVEVACDREGLGRLVNQDMRGPGGLLSYNRRGIARSIVEATADEAVSSGRLQSHLLAKVKLIRGEEAEVVEEDGKRFIFPSHDQVQALAEGLGERGIGVWLMRGCGLRVREALGVERGDFARNGRTLRLVGQASLDGRRREALKHRRAGQGRTIPVPGYLWSMVRDHGPGPLVPSGNGGRYATYNSFYMRFVRAARRAGIEEGYSPRQLRHAYSAALLASGVPLTTVSKWLGHRDATITSRVYAKLLPDADDQGRAALDSEFARWRDGEEMAA